jgi:Txe/YoeB family toxin of Txe-Axe toxin-antitoxin module
MRTKRVKLEKIPEVEEAIKTIPSSAKILNEAIEFLKLKDKGHEEIANNFGKYVIELESTAHKIYEKYEKQAFEKLAEIWVTSRRDWILDVLKKEQVEGIKRILLEFIDLAINMEFRLSNKRKARGGKTFESIIERLLKLAKVRCEKPKKSERKEYEVLKNIDMVSPDVKTALEMRDKAIFISAKRTLRERWKQVTYEHLKGARLYLVTINGDISEGTANAMGDAGIIVYVPDEVKEREYLKDKPWIRKISELVKDIKNSVPESHEAV